MFESETDGFFYVEPIREFNPVLAVMGHGFFPWALCVKRADSWLPLHQEREYTLVDTGPAFLVRLTCSVDDKCKAEHIWAPSEELIEELEERAKK